MKIYAIKTSGQYFQEYKNLQEYKKLLRLTINGNYHGKMEYIDNIDNFDRFDNIDDNDEKAYKNLDELEKDIINIISKARSSIIISINSLLKKDSKIEDKLYDFYHLVKTFYPEKAWTIEKFLFDNNLDRIKPSVEAIFTYPKIPRTYTDFETKIRDDYILNELHSKNII